VDGDIDTPVEANAYPTPVKIDLLMGDLGCMQEDAILNYPAHLISRCGATNAGHVVVVTIHGRHASIRATTHGARGLESTVDCAVRQSYGERVLSTVEGEHAHCRVHSITAAIDAPYRKSAC